MGTAARGGARHRIGATALTAAFVGGLLGGAPPAQAAPPPADDGAAAGTPEAGTDVPSVWPRPQSIRAQGGFVPVGREVTLVADEDADEAALKALRDVLRDAGARTVHEVDAAEAGRPGADRRGLTVRAGSRSAAGALRVLQAAPRGDLPAGGYRLAVGRAAAAPGGAERDTVALDGVDGEGLFHAVQTLRELVTEEGGSSGFAGVTVRDWPAAPVRGITEGFYGQSWSEQERLSQLDFLGRTKQNHYLYAPGDDPYRQAAHWRDPYPAEARASFRRIAERAEANHVQLGWAVAPGQGLCFSGAEDRRALLRKIDSMRALGFTAFQLQFEDVSYSEWHCDEDAETYGSGPEAAARAQAELANDVAGHLARRHPDAAPLSVMPTEYYQDGATKYRTALATALHGRIEIAWTGVGVVPRTITGGELAGARSAFQQHPLVTMDNYPVNDYAQDRVFMGPYRGREPAVASGSAALLTNAMKQPNASRIPLFTAADYAWNPRGYRPEESWKAAIDDLAGGPGADARTREAVRTVARNDASSVLDREESAYLKPLMKDLWAAYDGHDTRDLQRAARELDDAYGSMRTARDHVPEKLRGEVGRWLEELALHGEAGGRAVDMLLAQSRGDGATAWQARLDLQKLRSRLAGNRTTVGDEVLPAFTEKALKSSDRWLGVRDGDTGAQGGKPVQAAPEARLGSSAAAAADGDPSTAYRSAATPATSYFAPRPDHAEVSPAAPGRDPAAPGGLTLPLPRARSLEAVTIQTGPESGTRADVAVHVPGKGWQRLGALSADGWTQLDAKGVTADAVRLTWREGSSAPVVHEVTPWYADASTAALSLSRDEVYAPIGGGSAHVSAEIRTRRPEDVRGRLRAEAPEGFSVRAPRRTDVPRGGIATGRLEIAAGKSVKPGSYRIPVTFGDQRRTLTVRAFPRTGGADLARGAKAESSADETPDFPASAVNDDRSSTRWSSPAEDGEWVQLRLRKPTRIGQVVLHWQDAHAKRYRVQVSPDGKRWRTAATVRDGRGGRESVRMNAPSDTRYIRVQGEKRATRFGYSLWSLEAYAVQEQDGKHAGGR